MTRPIALLDVDGPLANFSGAYLADLALLTGVQRKVEEIDRFAIWDCPWFAGDAARVGWTAEDLRTQMEGTVVLSGFCADLEVQPGAKEAVATLSELADVFCVTSPWHSSRTWVHERTAWLHKHFGIKASRVIHASTKHIIHGDVFVDDKASHVEAWGKAWPSGRAILFDMHHNRMDEGLVRGGWAEVIAAAGERKAA